MTIKILNLYAGIGGNRKLWDGDIEVTAVENVPEIAAIYSGFFPDDKIVIGDAHQYLLEHYKEFDFIWSSPPCPTHSGTNNSLNAQGVIRYPDMGLYQEIIFLQKWFKGRYAIENVIPYYEPLIPAQKCGRHLFWCNFKIGDIKAETEVGTFNRQPTKLAQRAANQEYMNPNRDWMGFNLKGIKINPYKKRQLLRNCIHPKIGAYVLRMAFKEEQKVLAI